MVPTDGIVCFMISFKKSESCTNKSLILSSICTLWFKQISTFVYFTDFVWNQKDGWAFWECLHRYPCQVNIPGSKLFDQSQGGHPIIRNVLSLHCSHLISAAESCSCPVQELNNLMFRSSNHRTWIQHRIICHFSPLASTKLEYVLQKPDRSARSYYLFFPLALSVASVWEENTGTDHIFS